jgi:hypothetical protein
MRRERERTENFPGETMLRVGGGNEKSEKKTKGNNHVGNSSNVGC